MAKLTLEAEPGSHALEMSGVFAAPRDLVYRAHTDPALVSEWWGSRSTTTIIDELDVRKGGRWRYISRGSDGEEYVMSGVYHFAKEPEQLIYTFEFEPMPGHVVLETLTFEELPDGSTRIVDSSVFQSVADRDAMIGYGMEGGAQESWDRLEELLAKLAQESGAKK